MPLHSPLDEHTLSNLDPRLQRQFETASAALKKGELNYVIRVASNWVQAYSNVPEFRMLLREAQIRHHYPDRNFGDASNGLVSNLFCWLSTGERNLGKFFLKCETRLESDPLDLQANDALSKVTQKLGWVRTEIFTLQTLLLHPKRKPEHVLRLIQAMMKNDQAANAAKVCETFLPVFPTNKELKEARDRISIHQSIQQVENP